MDIRARLEKFFGRSLTKEEWKRFEDSINEQKGRMSSAPHLPGGFIPVNFFNLINKFFSNCAYGIRHRNITYDGSPAKCMTMCQIRWNGEQYILHIPRQNARYSAINYEKDPGRFDEIAPVILEIHSKPLMKARFSLVDDDDERHSATSGYCLYFGVAGMINTDSSEIVFSYYNNEGRVIIPANDIFK